MKLHDWVAAGYRKNKTKNDQKRSSSDSENIRKRFPLVSLRRRSHVSNPSISSHSRLFFNGTRHCKIRCCRGCFRGSRFFPYTPSTMALP
jgi:hypothetical protein